MRTYVYGCDKDKSHPRVEVRHSIDENPDIRCFCGSKMHRIPQPLLGFYDNADQILVNWMSDNYMRKRNNLPLVSPYKCKRPGKPLPQLDYHTRRRIKNGIS